MPKEVVVVDQFHGGEDSNTDARDIAFEDSTKLMNIEVSENLETDKKGKVRMAGSFIDAGVSYPLQFSDDDNFNPSIALHQSPFLFGQDYMLINPISGNPATGSQMEYLKPTLIAFNDGRYIAIYDSSAELFTFYTLLHFGVEVMNETVTPIYYVADGGLVIGNANFGDSQQSNPQLLKLCKRTMMQYTDNEQSVSKWYFGEAKPSSPPGDIISWNESSPGWGHVGITFGAGSGNDMMESMQNVWEFGASYRVDENEETDITPDTSGYTYDMTTTSPTDAPHVNMQLKCGDIDGHFGERVTAIRIYMKVLSSQDWYLLASIDLKKASWYMPTYSPFKYDLILTDESDDRYSLIDEGELVPWFAILPLEDYQYYSGRDPEDTLPVQYKTAVVSGKRTWVGNIRQNGVFYGDRMMKSVARQYNVFPEANWIDVVTDDGDEIIKLEAFADRILQFKKSILYIINAPPQGGEFLEAQYNGYGIDYASATTLTPNGVVFANKQGLFLYDSEKINNLFISREVNKVSREDWKNFTTVTDDEGNIITRVLRVGFDPENDIVHVYNDIKKGYKVSLINKAVSQVSDVSLNSAISGLYTYRNKMYVSSYSEDMTSLNLSVWSNTPQINTIELITRDFDLGEPSIRKRVYRIWITYKSDLDLSARTGAFLYFNTNGSSTFIKTYDSSDSVYGDTSGRLQGTAGEWKRAWFKPNSSDVKNIYSTQIKITSEDSTTTNDEGNGVCYDPGFEIDDISITFRRKRAK